MGYKTGYGMPSKEEVIAHRDALAGAPERAMKQLSSLATGFTDGVGELGGFAAYLPSKLTAAQAAVLDRLGMERAANAYGSVSNAYGNIAGYLQDDATANVTEDALRFFGQGEYGKKVADQMRASAEENPITNFFGEWGIPTAALGKILNQAGKVKHVPEIRKYPPPDAKRHYRMSDPTRPGKTLKVNGEAELLKRIVGPHIGVPAAAWFGKEIPSNFYEAAPNEI